MPYGNAQKLGATIDPRFMQVDYSAIERAGATLGNAMANIGKNIGDAMKLHSETEKDIKTKENLAKSIATAFKGKPLGLMAEDALRQFSNPNLSQRDRSALAAGIEKSLDIGVLGMNSERADTQFAAQMKLERDKLDAARNTRERDPRDTITYDEMPMVVNGVSGRQAVKRDGWGNVYDMDDNLISGPAKSRGQSGGIRGAVEMLPTGGVQTPATPVGGWDANPALRGESPDNLSDAQLDNIAGLGGPPNVAFAADGLMPITPPAQAADIQRAIPVQDPRDNAGVLPERGAIDRAKQFPVGFVPDESKGAPQTVTLEDGSKAFGTMQNGVFVPAKTEDGKPIIAPKEVDPQIAAMEAKKAAEDAAARTKAESDIAKSEQFLRSLQALEQHSGFNNLFGINVGTPTWVPGSAGADAKALLEQVTAKAFMESIQSLKGMGALSNAEGEKASAAFIALKPSMSEKEARASLKIAQDIVEGGMARAKTILADDKMPHTGASRATNASSRLRELIPATQ